MTGALANKHCLYEMDEEILPRSRITNQKLEMIEKVPEL